MRNQKKSASVLKKNQSVTEWADTFLKCIVPRELRMTVEALPAPRNRLHALEAMVQTENFLMHEFQRLGWQCQKHPFHLTTTKSFFDYDAFSPTIYDSLDGTNIVALKPGSQGKEVLLVLAHYDTVRDSPGADDNTASVVALLELARLLAPYHFATTIMLVATDYEELGALGGKVLVEEILQTYEVLGVINFETMAYTTVEPNRQQIPPGMTILYPHQVHAIKKNQNRGNFTTIIYNKHARQLSNTLALTLDHITQAQRTLLIRDPNDLFLIGGILRYILPSIRNFSRGDHASFWEHAISAVQITDTANFRNPHYHKETDSADTIDYNCLATIIAATAATLAQMGNIVEIE